MMCDACDCICIEKKLVSLSHAHAYAVTCITHYVPCGKCQKKNILCHSRLDTPVTLVT